MDEKTLTALKASIEKWERNAVARSYKSAHVKGDTCALCTMFAVKPYCKGCPVSAVTKVSGCQNTPWVAAFNAWGDWRFADADKKARKDAFHAAAREEVAFLKSLIPQEASDA